MSVPSFTRLYGKAENDMWSPLDETYLGKGIDWLPDTRKILLHERRIPEWLRHAPAPSVRGFAVLAGTEAIARSILISVFPVVMYNTVRDARLVSEVYVVIGAISLVIEPTCSLSNPVHPKVLGYGVSNQQYVAI